MCITLFLNIICKYIQVIVRTLSGVKSLIQKYSKYSYVSYICTSNHDQHNLHPRKAKNPIKPFHPQKISLNSQPQPGIHPIPRVNLEARQSRRGAPCLSRGGLAGAFFYDYSWKLKDFSRGGNEKRRRALHLKTRFLRPPHTYIYLYTSACRYGQEKERYSALSRERGLIKFDGSTAALRGTIKVYGAKGESGARDPIGSPKTPARAACI